MAGKCRRPALWEEQRGASLRPWGPRSPARYRQATSRAAQWPAIQTRLPWPWRPMVRSQRPSIQTRPAWSRQVPIFTQVQDSQRRM